MITISEQAVFNTTEEFLMVIRLWEKNCGKSWGSYIGVVNGHEIQLKTYGRSYPQKFIVNGINRGGLCDMKVNAFNKLVTDALTR